MILTNENYFIQFKKFLNESERKESDESEWCDECERSDESEECEKCDLKKESEECDLKKETLRK